MAKELRSRDYLRAHPGEWVRPAPARLPPPEVVGLLLEDWELNPATGGPPIAVNKLPRKVVEGRAEVVDGLSEKDSPFRTWLSEKLETEGERLLVAIEVAGESVRLVPEEDRELSVEMLDVLACARKLGPNTF